MHLSSKLRRTLTLLITMPALVFAFAACGDVGDAPQARTGNAVSVSGNSGEVLPIDTSQSELRWRAAKVTRAHDGGFRSFSGNVTTDEDGEVSGIQIDIETESIWSDTDRLTNHLKDADFFDVGTYPRATFEADEVVPVDSSGFTHLVTGNLSMHGEVKSISFPAKISGEADGDIHALGDFIIDRRQWAINYDGQPDDLIRDDVRIIFDITASRNGSIAEPAAD